MTLLRLLKAFIILVCAYSPNLFAQDGEKFGPLLPSGQSPELSPLLGQYSVNVLPLDPLGTPRIISVLNRLQRVEPQITLRGAREVDLYRTLSTSVTLVLVNEGSGSGSLLSVKPTPGSALKTGVILTNWHVVGDAREVGIVFKPQLEGQTVGPASVLRGLVRKVDPVRDLALIEVVGVPIYVMPIEIGSMNEVQVGADVHAIGHPSGETWTYTKGLVSQIRPHYEWQTESAIKHKADVIQTQTPINPGNSGGPLISDSGHLIGVNSFKAKGEALNFAVSVGEVRKFLTAAAEGAFDVKAVSAATKPCEGKIMYEGRAKSNDAFIKNVDLACKGRVDATLYIPDDKSKPVAFRIDRNNDGKVDVWIFDEDRDGKWDISLWDEDFDGKPDLVGYHPDGEIKPSRFEKYRPKS